jgi:hypothetical protein
MQAPPVKLHWFPIEPTWIVALIIVILAALPHQLPIPLSFGLRTTFGRLIGFFGSLVLWYYKPILGTACLFLLVTTNMSEYVEGFVITKDKIRKSGTWSNEIEAPDAIQERSVDDIINSDEVQGDHRWGNEIIDDIHPESIQERSTPTEVYQESYSRK